MAGTNLAIELLNKLEKTRPLVVIIGDVLVDHWIHGHTELSQDGCNKLIEAFHGVTPGGAGNARESITNWPVTTDLFGQIGTYRPQKYRFVNENNKIIFRYDKEDRIGNIPEATRRSAIEAVRSADAVLLSDYDKGFLTPEFIQEVVRICSRLGIPCVADCKQEPEVYAGCILKCNQDYQHKHNEQLSRLVYDAKKPQQLVVTCGPDIPAAWDKGILQRGFPFLPPVSCINHVGAGDCFAAHLTMALAAGFSLKEGMAIAHSAGRVYVQWEHNKPPLPEEVTADMEGTD